MGKRYDSSLGKKIRSAEKKLTKRLVRWRLKHLGLPTPDEETLDRGSELFVDEAHRIIKRRGKSILEELKQAKKEFQEAYQDERKNDKG